MSVSIPKTQKAALVVASDAPILIKDDHPVKQPEELAPGECLIKMHCTGVCHTDLHARIGDWPLPHKLPLVGGHEGVGDIVAIGANTIDSPVKIGDRVGVKWLADSCLQCEQCRKGLEQCTPLTTFPARRDAKLIGMTGSQAVPRRNSVDTPWMEHSPNTWYDFSPHLTSKLFSAIRFLMLLMSRLSPRISTAKRRHLFSARWVLAPFLLPPSCHGNY